MIKDIDIKLCTIAVVLVVLTAATLLVVSLGTIPVTVNEGESATFYWHGNDIRVETSEHVEYYSIARTLNPAVTSNQFVTPDDPVIQALYRVMEPDLATMTDTQKANELLRFVHYNIPYANDMEVYGDQVSQFPSETLMLGHGDCEDMAFLLCTLYELAGLDAVLLHFEEHMAVGVAVDAQGEVYHALFNGTDYYLADPVGSYTVGGSYDTPLVGVYQGRTMANEVVLLFLIPTLIICGLCSMIKRNSLGIHYRKKKIVYTHSKRVKA